MKLMNDLINVMEREQDFPVKENQKQSKYYEIILEKMPHIIEMIFIIISKYFFGIFKTFLKINKI